MQRPLAVLVALAAILLVTGCGSSTTSPPPATAAPPQAAELGWDERSPDTGPALIFRVHRFAVTNDGWEADVEVENRTGIAWEIGEDPVAVEQSFGIMLFATSDLDEVEQRSRNADLPGLRPAQVFVPSLPSTLRPEGRWRGTVSAPAARSPPAATSASCSARWSPSVTPPDGMPSRFVWITDHAYRLRS